MATGAYVEIPGGLSPRHPFATTGAGRHRAGRVPARAPREAPHNVHEGVRVDVRRAAPPLVRSDGTVFLWTTTGLTALGPDLAAAWSLDAARPLGGLSLLAGGELGAWVEPRALLVLGANGARRALVPVGAAPASSPIALDDGSFAVTLVDRSLLRYDRGGTELRRAVLPADTVGETAWSDAASSFVVATGSEVVWIDLDGAVTRRTRVGARLVTGPAIGPDGAVWVVGAEGVAYAFDVHGRLDVEASLGGDVEVRAPFVVGFDGDARIGTRDRGLVCISRAGSERWRQPGGGPIASPMIVDAEGTLLFVNGAGALVAIDADGALRWSVATGAARSMPPLLGPDGTVYLVSSWGTFQAWAN